MQANDVNTIEALDVEGEALFKANIEAGETTLVKLRGRPGQAFAVTDRRVYVLRYGFRTGYTGGGNCSAYGFNQVTGVTITKRMALGIIQVMTAAKGSTRPGNPFIVDNMIDFMWDAKGEAFQRGVSIARKMMQKTLEAITTHAVAQQSAADEIGKLAVLRDKGILTEEEFQAKKRQLLGL